MAIKPAANEIFFTLHQDQARLAQRLDEAFDINFGRAIDQLYFWIAEPQRHTKERFGLYKEVLIIYSPHTSTDARVLTTISYLSSDPDYRYRIDRVLVILIHNGLSSEVDEIAKDQFDWVVVPFTAEELLGPRSDSFYIRNRIAEFIAIRDLFGMSSPIKSDAYFFGRQALVQSLISRLTVRGENAGLFGLRKTGKTSVLFATHRRFHGPEILSEYFDCSGAGFHASRWWQALGAIVDRLVRTAHEQSGKRVKTAPASTIEEAGSAFGLNIRAILDTCNYGRIVIMLDEIEYITPHLSGALGAHWDSDFVPFFQTIRATHQELAGRITFIVAGVNPASVEHTHFGHIPNPIFQLAAPHFLSPLDTGQIREMVRQIGRYLGLHFEEGIYSYLRIQYGGHPYLIRLACSEAWNRLRMKTTHANYTVNISDFDKVKNEIQHRLSQPIRDILLSLAWWYPDEYDLLEIIASGEPQFFEEYRRSLPEQTMNFVRYGLIDENGSFMLRDMQYFLINFGRQYKAEVSPFTRTDFPLEQLPTIPNIEDLTHLFTLKTELEILLRKIVVFYMGMKYGWDGSRMATGIAESLKSRKERPDPWQIFVGREVKDVINDLYIIDFKDIVTNHWQIFRNLFDDNKARFEMNMDTANIARRVDSHTKPLNENELDEFKNSY